MAKNKLSCLFFDHCTSNFLRFFCKPSYYRLTTSNISFVIYFFLLRQVDQIEKSKVNESVHDFLLTLCTSQKYGVVFKDSLVGLGKKNQNALLYTVLESLDR